MLRGNHPSIDDKTSSVEYLQWLNVTLFEEIVEKDSNVYFGHFIVNESLMNFNNTTKSIKELAKFKYVFLGHQHHPQDLGNNRYHLGSVRYTSFGELNSDKKRIARLEGDKLEFIKLKSPYPLVEVFNINELEDVEFDSKVRLTIKTFEQFKNDMGKVEKWKNKFKSFKVKLDFTTNPTEAKKIDKVDNLRTVIEKWLSEINDVDVKKELEKEFNETK
jgi:DNA repair exonuclease SbcCD nuclease subunit